MSIAKGGSLRRLAAVLALARASVVCAIGAEDGGPAAKPAGGDPAPSLEFDTPRIAGTIRLEGPYHGVARLVDKRSGRQLIDERYSALNLFKLMSANLVMGQPRKMERTTALGPGWAEIRWAADDAHRADLVARYEVHPPDAIDLTVTLRARGIYAAYELFLSNYFDAALQPHVYLRTRDRAGADLVIPWVNDAFRGTVLVFPRDAHAARRCLDGRWDRCEGGTPTVQMCPVRHYAHCVATMAAPDKTVAAVLMADPRDCYAVSARYHADAPADRLTTYSAFDLSLFGCDVVPDDVRRVKVRLVVTAPDAAFSQPLALYRAFLDEENGLGQEAKGKTP